MRKTITLLILLLLPLIYTAKLSASPAKIIVVGFDNVHGEDLVVSPLIYKDGVKVEWTPLNSLEGGLEECLYFFDVYVIYDIMVPYDMEEIASLDSWIRSGGVLLITSFNRISNDLNVLARMFGAEFKQPVRVRWIKWKGKLLYEVFFETPVILFNGSVETCAYTDKGVILAVKKYGSGYVVFLSTLKLLYGKYSSFRESFYNLISKLVKTFSSYNTFEMKLYYDSKILNNTPLRVTYYDENGKYFLTRQVTNRDGVFRIEGEFSHFSISIEEGIWRTFASTISMPDLFFKNPGKKISLKVKVKPSFLVAYLTIICKRGWNVKLRVSAYRYLSRISISHLYGDYYVNKYVVSVMDEAWSGDIILKINNSIILTFRIYIKILA